MKNIINKTVIIGGLMIAAILFTGCASTINSGAQGLIWRPWTSGLEQEEVYGDGIVWHWPWNDIIEYEVQWNSYQEKVYFLTADDLHMAVTTSVVLRPKTAELPRLELEVGSDYYNRLVKPEFFTVTRNVMAQYLYNEIPTRSPEIERKILFQLKERLKTKYLEFDNITLDHLMYSPIVTEATDLKLAKQEELAQKDFETGIAEKDAEIQRIIARGQRDSQIIIAEGMTTKYLQFKSLQVQEKLATSPNAKFYYIPVGENGLPLVIETESK